MSVAEIIEAQFGSRQCTGHDGLYCKECERVTDCTSCLNFQCPQTLCCRIIPQGNGRDEQPRFPTITEKLKIKLPSPDRCDDIAIFDLKAIICFVGQISSAGHYVTYGKRKVETGETLFLFDDEVVRPASFQEVIEHVTGRSVKPRIRTYCSTKGFRNRDQLQEYCFERGRRRM